MKKDKLISTMSYVNGELIYLNPKNPEVLWKWKNFMDVQEIPLNELHYMKNYKERFLMEPFLIVLDNEAIKELKLQDFYSTLIFPWEFEKLYCKNLEEQSKILNSLPASILDIIYHQIIKRIASGVERDLFNIKFYETTFTEIMKRANPNAIIEINLQFEAEFEKEKKQEVLVNIISPNRNPEKLEERLSNFSKNQ